MALHKRDIHPSQRTDVDAPSRAVCARVGQKNCHHMACPRHKPTFSTHCRAVLAIVK